MSTHTDTPRSTSKPGGQGGRVRLERRAVADLVPAPFNPREISEDALAGLGASIDRFGLVQPIIVNERTRRIVGGHQRAKALQVQGVTETDVVLVDLDDAEEKALNLALNSGEISGRWTADALPLLEEVRLALPELSGVVRLPELEATLGATFPPSLVEVEQDEVPEPPADPVTKPGDVWVLGRHRLVCGDATTKAAALAMRGHSPFMMVTDPPYGVEYDPEWRVKSGLNTPAARGGTVRNDERADWQAAYNRFSGDVAYVWHGALHATEVAQNLIAEGFDIRGQIIWRKERFAIGRGAYHWGHEPCWYGVRKGRTARWAGDRKQSAVWDIKRPQVGEGGEDTITDHGTQKPVECMARPIRNHGAPGDTVYDPFLGSGTTLIAAEQLDRSCVGLELDPAYCDVIVQRFEAFTGEKAKRVSA